MSGCFGARVDVGQEVKPGIMLLTICKYGCMRTDGFFCPYHSINRYDTHFRENSARVEQAYFNCPSDALKRKDLLGPLCYATQTTEMYIQDHHVIKVNGKEVRIMDMKEIKEARRTADGNCVAIDDIVDVKVGYINDHTTREALNNLKSFTGRIISFENKAIVFDLSTQYRSKQVDINYTELISMCVHEEKKDANCN